MENRNLSFKTAFKKLLVENKNNESHELSNSNTEALSSETAECIAGPVVNEDDAPVFEFIHYLPSEEKTSELKKQLPTYDAPENLRKLYVANVDKNVKEAELKKYFEKFGEVEICVIDYDCSEEYSVGSILFKQPDTVANVLTSKPHAINNKEIIFSIPKKNAVDPECYRKIIVTRLNPYTNEEILKSYFKNFGALESCVIMRERKTRKPRCFGYVIFKEACSIANVVAAVPHRIHNRSVWLIFPCENDVPEHLRKIYFKNLNYETAEDIVVYYFEQFGSVECCIIEREDVIGKSKGYGHVIFEKPHVVDDVLNKGPHEIDYRQVLLGVLESREQFYCTKEKSENVSSEVNDRKNGAYKEEVSPFKRDKINYIGHPCNLNKRHATVAKNQKSFNRSKNFAYSEDKISNCFHGNKDCIEKIADNVIEPASEPEIWDPVDFWYA